MLSLCRVFLPFNAMLTLLVCSTAIAEKTPEILSLSHSTTNTWREYSLKKNPKKSPKKWVWVSSLSFKSNEARQLKKIKLKWKGKKISTVFASLFQKYKQNSDVVPIEKNLICDGIWDKRKQELTFYLDEKILATCKYEILLSFPKREEKVVKKGSFNLTETQTQ